MFFSLIDAIRYARGIIFLMKSDVHLSNVWLIKRWDVDKSFWFI